MAQVGNRLASCAALPNGAVAGRPHLGASWAITRLNASSPPAAAHDGERADHNSSASARLESAASL
jgi:hypothetical protein